MLKMSPYEFDQSEHGWRMLDKVGKYLEAAELIEEYISTNESLIVSQKKLSI